MGHPSIHATFRDGMSGFPTSKPHSSAPPAIPMSTADIWRMIRRRSMLANIKSRIGCHGSRATGSTNHKGLLEKSQQLVSHASPRTTKLYGRTHDQINFDEVENTVIYTSTCRNQ